MNLHTNTLPPATSKTLDQIKNLNCLKKFYLTGGTTLSLLIGHRESEDLDFFNRNDFDPLQVQKEISEIGKLKNTSIEEGTLNTYFEGVKLQFLHYPYDLLDDFIKWNEINLSSISDIACTKLITISMRGSKKDFIDLFFILKQMTLEELFAKLEKKYTNTQYNSPHILKSLIYFNEADQQPMPRMKTKVSWQQVKDFIIKQTKSFKF